MMPGQKDKAARCGEPSYIWRAGQERRLAMILQAAGERAGGRVLDDGCGVGAYLERLAPRARVAFGVELDHERAVEAGRKGQSAACAAGEALPFPAASFDLVLSHEVLEHVGDDRRAVAEAVRVLKPGGRMIVFAPNRGYPFETHGIFWKGNYWFGNVPLVNYLPRAWRDRLAPHVRAYSSQDLGQLFSGLPVRFVRRAIIFGAYDNIIARWPAVGRTLRAMLQGLERTPLRRLGLSQVWVVEKETS